MLLIGDGGSTKVDWWFYKNGTQSRITTMGFNPLFHTVNSVLDGLGQSAELKEISKEVSQIYFFGAACSEENRNAIIENAFHVYFPNADSNVNHDLMGAAVATCKGDTGIACILGTGSNAAYFDGNGFPNRVPSLGYVLGDEGGGVYIGKKLLADYLYGLVPIEIEKLLSNDLKLNKEIIFRNVYQKEHANIYLASFTKELSKFKNLDYTEQLISNCFDDFIKYHVLCYPQSQQCKVHFVGSVAYNFKEILIKCLKKSALIPGTIIEKPGKEILNYYLSKTV